MELLERSLQIGVFEFAMWSDKHNGACQEIFILGVRP